MIYRKRRNLFEKDECEWRVEPDALVFRDAHQHEIRLAWRDVKAVRLAYAPTRAKTWRHVFVLTMKSGLQTEIDNAHFAGIGDFEDRSASYAPFVRAALARIKAEAPDAVVRVGSSPLAYLVQAAFVLAAFAGLAAVLLLLPVSFSGIVIVKLALIAAFLPMLWRWLKYARPRRASFDALPDDAFPAP